MNPDAVQIAALLSPYVYGVLLVFCRVGAAMMLMPGYSERAVPQRIRLITGLAVAVAMAGNVPGLPERVPGQVSAMVTHIGCELAVGLLLGTCARVMLFAISAAGSVISQSLQQMPGTPHAIGFEYGEAPVGTALMVGALALVFTLGLHEPMLRAVHESYAALPFGVMPDPSDMANAVATGVATAFRLGFQMAMPVTLVTLLVNIGLGATNRAMPNMPVFFVGAPVVLGMCMMTVAAIAAAMLMTWAEAFDAFLAGGMRWPG